MAIGMSTRDPIFLLHHANIDRLWQVWLNQGGSRANPREQRWLDQRFTFPRTSDFEFVEYKVSEMLNTEQSPGKYRYDRERLIEQTVVASGGPAVTRFSLNTQDNAVRNIAGPGLQVEIPARLQESLVRIGADDTGRAAVILEGVPIPDQPSTIRVFAAPTGTGNRTFIGSFSTLPSRATRDNPKQRIVLPITESARQFLTQNSNVAIIGEVADAPGRPITVDNFSIEVGP